MSVPSPTSAHRPGTAKARASPSSEVSQKIPVTPVPVLGPVPDPVPIDELAQLELEALNAQSFPADHPPAAGQDALALRVALDSEAGVNGEAPPPTAAVGDLPPPAAHSTHSSSPHLRPTSPAPVQSPSPAAAPAPVTVKSLLIKVQELTDRVAQVERNEWLLKRENVVCGRRKSVLCGLWWA
jgi:hypothetical protein